MKKILTVLMITLIGAVSLTSCGNETGKVKQTVSTDGSTSMEKLIGTIGESFEKENPDIKFTYNPTGSSSGITAVAEGRCDLGLSSRKLKEDEKASGLVETVIAYDGIAIIVNKKNNIDDLSKEQIADIFTGKIKNWQELGGDNKEIVLIGREAGSGTRDGFETITETEGRCEYRQEVTSTGDVITTVSGNESAIGYASLASVKDSVKKVSVDGVIPNEQSISDGKYKIQRPFIVVTKKDKKLSKAAEKCFEYIKSKEANAIIKSAGVVPAN